MPRFNPEKLSSDLYEKVGTNISTPSKKYSEMIKERERQLG